MPELELEVWTENSSLSDGHLKRTSTSRDTSNWTFLPAEIWLLVLVDYGVTSKDLVHLDYCCKWFSNSWQGKCNFCNSR